MNVRRKKQKLTINQLIEIQENSILGSNSAQHYSGLNSSAILIGKLA
jgi:hypothetical protein